MGDVKKVRTACRQCHGGCGVIAHVQDGKVIKVEGDPESPISHGTLCSKGIVGYPVGLSSRPNPSPHAENCAGLGTNYLG